MVGDALFVQHTLRINLSRHQIRNNRTIHIASRAINGNQEQPSTPSPPSPPPPPPPPPPSVGWLWDRKSSKTKPISRQSLREQNIRPRKSLGQNFMTDDAVLNAIATAALLQPGDPVLEIGPGTGALTHHLLATGASITAVEKDEALFLRLVGGGGGGGDDEESMNFTEQDVNFICGDILRLDLPQLLDSISSNSESENEHNKGKVKVVANLPYYITKDFLTRALPLSDRVSHLLLMLQDEVALRLTAPTPGGPEWRAMNIIVQYYSEASYLFKIDRKKYIPVPKVDGAVVDFRLKGVEERVPVPDERRFISLVKKSFLQRRKALRNSLQPLVPGDVAVRALEAVGLSPDARAQELGLEEFARLSWEVERLMNA